MPIASRKLYIGVPVILLAAAAGLDERTRGLAANTLALAGASAALALPLGTALGLLLFRTDLPGRRGLRMLTVVLLFLPLYLQATGWLATFAALGRPGWRAVISGADTRASWRWCVAAWLHAAAGLPWVVWIVGLAARRDDRDLEDAARLEYGTWGVLGRVVLPRVSGAMALAAVWLLLMVVGEMTISDLFMIRTFAEELYTGFSLTDEPLQVVRSLSAGMLAAAALTVLAGLTISRLGGLARPGSQRAAADLELGPRGRWWVAAPVWALLGSLMLAPVISLAWQAGVVSTQGADGMVRGWSAARCAAVVAAGPWRFASELRWSLTLDVLAASLAMAVAIPLAWWGRGGGLRAAPALLVAAICVAAPGPLWGLFAKWLLNRPHLAWLHDRTVASPTLALALRGLPLALLMSWHAFRSLPREQDDLARVAGVGEWRQLVVAGLPQAGRGLFAGWLVAMAIAHGDLAASILVLPPGVSTASVRLFGLVHSQVREDESALALTLIALTALIACGVSMALSRGPRGCRRMGPA